MDVEVESSMKTLGFSITLASKSGILSSYEVVFSSDPSSKCMLPGGGGERPNCARSNVGAQRPRRAGLRMDGLEPKNSLSITGGVWILALRLTCSPHMEVDGSEQQRLLADMLGPRCWRPKVDRRRSKRAGERAGVARAR